MIDNFETLSPVPVCDHQERVVDGAWEDSIEALYKEVKAIKQRSLRCSMAAYRSRIAQVTYIYNSMVHIFNNMEDKTEEDSDKIFWVRDELSSMWEAYREW